MRSAHHSMLADALCWCAGVLTESAPGAEALGGPTPSDAQQASDASFPNLQVLAGMAAEPTDWSTAGPDPMQGGHSQQAPPAEGQLGPAMPPPQHQPPLEQMQPASGAGQQTAPQSGAAKGAGDAPQQPAKASAGTVFSLGLTPRPDNPAPGVSPAAFRISPHVIGAGAGMGTAGVEGTGAGAGTGQCSSLHRFKHV